MMKTTATLGGTTDEFDLEIWLLEQQLFQAQANTNALIAAVA